MTPGEILQASFIYIGSLSSIVLVFVAISCAEELIGLIRYAAKIPKRWRY
ncbi:hypothetical protein ABNF65_12905 [Paenibacillus larvae]